MNLKSTRPIVPPTLVLFTGLLAVSTASLFIRFAQQGAPSLVIAAYRLSLATLLLMPVALQRKHRNELHNLRRGDLWLAALAGLFLAVHFAAWITSLEYTSVASSVILVTTTPLWVGLASPFLLKEPLSKPVAFGMFLALLGGGVVGLSDSCSLTGLALSCPSLREFFRGTAFLGDFLALVGAWMAAAYVIIGRRLRARVSLVSYIFVVYGIAAAGLILLMILAGQKPFGYPSQTYLWFFLLALVPQIIGHSSFNWALQYLSAAYVAVTLLGEPVGSAILAFFFLNEVPPPLRLFGAILTLLGIYIASHK